MNDTIIQSNSDDDEDDWYDYDTCYECSGYGDDYSIDPETGELICNCNTCIYNSSNSDEDD